MINGLFELTGLIDLQFISIPTHVSFSAIFRDAGGTEHPLTQPIRTIFARAGTSGLFPLNGHEPSPAALTIQQIRSQFKSSEFRPPMPDRSSLDVIDIGESPLQQGTHPGKILLRPDPNGAYPDPTIKAIWGGTLEFPVTITVKKIKDVPQAK